MTTKWTIGLMTGTVLDGHVDIAALRTDGERIIELGPWQLASYPSDVQGLLAPAMHAAQAWGFEGPEPVAFAQAETALTRAQAEAVNAFLASNGIAKADVAAIGFHGQTMLHRAARQGVPGATRQLGLGADMAAITGIDVVYDFRSSDVAAGGQGAPLAPAYHAALLEFGGLEAPAALLNLGGVGNVTWWGGGLGESARLAAFDTGPANAPINDWVKRHSGEPFDRDGALASAGRVHEDRVAARLKHPYFTTPYPKSLDRNDFTASLADGLSLEDGAATLTAFSAAAVAAGIDSLPTRPRRLTVSGGGRRNPVLMRFIAERSGIDVISADELGFRGDAVEAECFAYLAMRVLKGLPISFPATTGAPHPLKGGRIVRAAKS